MTPDAAPTKTARAAPVVATSDAPRRYVSSIALGASRLERVSSTMEGAPEASAVPSVRAALRATAACRKAWDEAAKDAALTPPEAIDESKPPRCMRTAPRGPTANDAFRYHIEPVRAGKKQAIAARFGGTAASFRAEVQRVFAKERVKERLRDPTLVVKETGPAGRRITLDGRRLRAEGVTTWAAFKKRYLSKAAR